jgi:3-oxoacyl-(acyl-carrier-protein) synthase
MRVFVEGIGLIGPGLENWPAARPVLAGTAPYESQPVRLQPIALLPPAERRRAGMTVKLAIATGVEALAHAGREAIDMPMVFAASGGDGQTLHETLSALATAQREVSPTRFHNSVHNAPSGYWAVATGSRVPSVSLSSFDRTFSAGLLEAAVQATVHDRPVTLIAYDMPYPEPLQTARPMAAMFGVALVLTPRRLDRALASLTIVMADTESDATGMADPALEQLRLGNPAARALPLLAAIASAGAATIHLDGIALAVTAA